MIDLTYSEAVDEMFAVIETANNASSTAIIGYVPQLFWPGVKTLSSPDLSKFWGRVSQQTVIEGQSSLSNCEGLPGQHRFTAKGFIIAQLFLPESNPEAMSKGRLWASVLKNSVRRRSTSGRVWFRDARIDELPQQNTQYRLNVVAVYEYDELG